MMNRFSFPKAYRDNYKIEQGESYINPNLDQLSTVSDADPTIRVSVMSKKYFDVFANIQTMRDVFKHGLELSRDRPLFGHRTCIDKDFEWMTYAEFDKRIDNIGSILINQLQLAPGSKVGIQGRNSSYWLGVSFACASYRLTYVPLYETLGEEAIKHILDQTQMTVVACNSVMGARNILNQSSASHVKHVLIFTGQTETANLKTEYDGKVEIHFLPTLLEQSLDSVEPEKVNPDDLLSICYTSGSSGLPKGVMISHKQLLSSIYSMASMLDGKYLQQGLVHFSYLPLSHIMEQLLSTVCVLVGGRLAFITEPPVSFKRDVADVRPTVLCAVPRVLNRVFDAVMSKVRNGLLKSTLNYAVKSRLGQLRKGNFDSTSKFDLFDKVFFKKIRDGFGGRVSGILLGSAPTRPEVINLFQAALMCSVHNSYGSTESCGSISSTPLGSIDTGNVGAILPGVELRLSDVEDMDINVERDKAGEICVRGPLCTTGYYANPEETEKLYDQDGFLHTGDVGQWTETGALKIIDRCKNMFKLAQAEYIAPEKLEMAYSNCKLVAQIFIDGCSLQRFPVALVVPKFAALAFKLKSQAHLMSSHLRRLLPTLTAKGDDVVTLFDEQDEAYKDACKAVCDSEEVEKYVREELIAVGRNHGLAGFERVGAIKLHTEAMTIENGLLTPTLKVSRYRARKHFSPLTKQLYDKLDAADAAAKQAGDR